MQKNTGKWQRYIPYLIILLIPFLLYLPSLGHGFVWDDWSIIFKEIKNLRGFSIYKPGGVYYRPITTLTFLLDQMIWKSSPLGYHLTNIIFHTLNTCLLFGLMASIMETKIEVKAARRLAILSALVFAAHPVHVESVSWIAGRTDLVVTFFALLAFFSYHLYRVTGNARGLIPTFLFFLLAMGSKETGIIVLPLIFLWELLVAPSLYGSRDNKALFTTLFMGIGLVLYIISRLPGIESYTGGIKTLAIVPLIKALGFYIRYLLIPHPILNYIPSIPQGNLYPAVGILWLVLPLLGIPFLSKKPWWIRGTIFSMLMTSLAILPSLALIVLGIGATPLAMRYLYLPSFFFSLALAFILVPARGLLESRSRSTVIAGLAILVLLAPITIHAQHTWKNDLIFWKKAVQLAPNNAIPHNQYGLALAKEGKIKEAQKEFIKALKAPDIQAYPWEKSKIYVNLGRALFQQGKFSKALTALNLATKFDPTNKTPYCDKANIYLAEYKSKKDKDLLVKAYQSLKECVSSLPTPARLLLAARLAFFLDKRKEADNLLQKLILQYPNSKEARSIVNSSLNTKKH